MSGIKITELPASTTPLSGSEIVPLVQGGVTKRATVTQIGTVTATGTTTPRTLPDRFADAVSVKDFGAVGDGVTDDTAAIQAAIDAVSSGAVVIVPGPSNYIVSGSLSFGGKHIFWDCEGATINGNAPSLVLRGSVAFTLGSGRRIEQRSGATGADVATVFNYRNADYTGGTPGVVNAGFLQTVDVAANVTAFEWAITSIINNYATGGENVAIYGQANKQTGAGPTFGMVAEARDKSNSADPASGLVGLEVDVFANGTDASGNRVGIDLVVGKGVPAGTACHATYGARLLPQNNDAGNGKFVYGLYAIADKNYFSGSVGVGTETPAVSLDVQKFDEAQIRTYENGSGVDLRLNALGGASDVGIVGTYSAHPVVFFANGSEVMRLFPAGNIGLGTTTPNASAAFDISSTTRGFLPPRMTSAQRDAINSPANGLLIYNTTTDKLQVRAASSWVDLH